MQGPTIGLLQEANTEYEAVNIGDLFGAQDNAFTMHTQEANEEYLEYLSDSRVNAVAFVAKLDACIADTQDHLNNP